MVEEGGGGGGGGDEDVQQQEKKEDDDAVEKIKKDSNNTAEEPELVISQKIIFYCSCQINPLQGEKFLFQNPEMKKKTYFGTFRNSGNPEYAEFCPSPGPLC